MDQPVELIPLLCVKCNTPVPAETDQVAWVCTQCGQGLSLDEEKGLAPLEVFYSADITPGAAGKPFWVADGRVTLQRQTFQGDQAKEALNFWNGARQFFVPAFASPLENLLNLGTGFLIQPPPLQPGPPARFEPVLLSIEDVQAAAEFIVVAIEAGRKDQLKEIMFSLDLSSPVLWILP